MPLSAKSRLEAALLRPCKGRDPSPNAIPSPFAPHLRNWGYKYLLLEAPELHYSTWYLERLSQDLFQLEMGHLLTGQAMPSHRKQGPKNPISPSIRRHFEDPPQKKTAKKYRFKPLYRRVQWFLGGTMIGFITLNCSLVRPYFLGVYEAIIIPE